MMDRHHVNTFLADARRAIDDNDHTDRGWNRVNRAIEQVFNVSSDPEGMTAGDVKDVIAIHADLLGSTDCDCPVCTGVAS